MNTSEGGHHVLLQRGNTLRTKEWDALSLYTFFQGNTILVKKLGVEAIDFYYKYCFIVKNSVYFMHPPLFRGT